MKNAAQLTRSFTIAHRDLGANEAVWIRTVFSAILKVARNNREFTVDEVWAEIDKMTAAKKMPKARIDHRILGPMIRHMVSQGLLGSSGYYAKSTRPGGGSRPVTIWTSYLYTRTKAKAAA